MTQKSTTKSLKINSDEFTKILERIESRLAKFDLDIATNVEQLKTATRVISDQSQMINSLESEISTLQTKNMECARIIKKLTENYIDEDL